ncbi:testis-specific serine/threonine-protein kinase 6-like [Anopheles albimanus]|uniref:Protein kinase domain-containing protein n=1 Tax=Anopheles albimanus TaxID=7167 RepID=A0A182FLF3_ANOAL|nr:testis-specific serine/threonine-protein kinase 6-like [Anopheles albimanus]
MSIVHHVYFRRALLQSGFHIGAKIGQGTFSSVRLAKHINRRGKIKLLACKIVKLDRCSGEFREKFFPRELEIITSLQHPHLLHVHRVLQLDQCVFIFMQYASGGDLLQYINEHGPLKESAAKRWFWQLLIAIRFLHSKGIAHRDLKCDNILINGRHELLVGDFGFAKRCWDTLGQPVATDGELRPHNWSETFCGSVAYAAPEVIMAQPYDPMVADIWSLGVVLFVLLNCTTPFGEENLARLARLQMDRMYVYSDRLAKPLTTEARMAIDEMLEPYPQQRITLSQLRKLKWLRTK